MSSIASATARPARRLGKWPDRLLKLGLSLLSPLLLLALLEGAAIVWERGQANGPYAWELVASRRMAWDQYPQPGEGYTLMQPGRHYEWQGISVDINAAGLRGPETTYAKPPGTFRILNLGDSVAMGWGAHEADTYGRQLEARLNAQAGGSLRYEVINAGVPGWNPANALAYLQAEGLHYEPDLVVLELTLANDIKGKSALLADDQPAPVRWLRTHTHFWPFLTLQMRWLQARAQGQARIDVIDPPTDPEKYFPREPDAEQWAEVWDRVTDMQRLAGEHQAPLVLVLFPLEFQVLDEAYPTLPQELLAAKGQAAGLPVVDLLPAFRQACREKPGGACQREDRYLFADVWMHPSALGHQLAAAEIEAVVARLEP